MKPNVVVVTRRANRKGVSIRESGEEFRNELKWLFVIELLLFGLLAAISVWPMVHTAEALRLP
jgi:hypothetical protein